MGGALVGIVLKRCRCRWRMALSRKAGDLHYYSFSAKYLEVSTVARSNEDKCWRRYKTVRDWHWQANSRYYVVVSPPFVGSPPSSTDATPGLAEEEEEDVPWVCLRAFSSSPMSCRNDPPPPARPRRSLGETQPLPCYCASCSKFSDTHGHQLE